jgi:hypothetical protein
MCYMAESRDDIKTEIRESGVIQECVRFIELYPQEDIDTSVLSATFNLLS